MAKASALAPGMQVRIVSGDYEGHPATIIDNTIVPDDDEVNRRKIKVQINDVMDVNDQPFVTYILPRLLDMHQQHVVDFTQQPDVSRFMPYGYEGQQQAALTMLTNDSQLLPPAEDITDAMDPALDRFRPDPSVVKYYISRTLAGGYSDIEYLLALRDERDRNGYSPNVALVGETQSGKTMLVQVLAVLAAERDGMPKPYPVFTLGGQSGVTNYDIFGQTSAVIINGKEVLVWMEGLAALAAKAGGFLYLDEWNAVNPGQAVALHPLLDDRRQFINTQKAIPDGHGGFFPEVVVANQDLWVLSTINPGGYKGTQTMAEATSNRFRWLAWDYDDETERALIPSKTVRLIGGHLREAHSQRVLTMPVGTSALQRLMNDCARFGVDMALWTFTSLFPPNERGRVDTIISDGGALDLLRAEFPEATLKPGYTEKVQVGSTWSADSIAAQV